MSLHEFAVIGAGIAGASIASHLAEQADTVLVERETQPGYHTTGRSAALYMATYGTPAIRALTRASRAFYDQPPPAFGPSALLSPRGVAHVAAPGQRERLEAFHREIQDRGAPVRWLDHDALMQAVPCLRPERAVAGVFEDGASDIDVHALHQGYLRQFRQRGGQLRLDAGVTALKRIDGVWILRLADGDLLQARTLVNAAGAWADVVAGLASVPSIGLQPCRRTAFTFAPPPGVHVGDWPAVAGIDESYYFKPDAGQLLGSPANADPVPPHDVMPEELDVATGIHHIEQATTLQIRRPSHCWAGLRSFVPDGDLVIGHDPLQEGFFWLAAQGGYGIQSAEGAARLALSLLRDRPLPEPLRAEGVDARALSPARLQRHAPVRPG
ncbi:D-arginine dehydrogenase [Sphaerotilus hippei]|uniref:D-arginine dehydrogenase n=1 Tax=Sphaerotilus hippei TaxID=744406 RepID=A0A318GZ20_9BURK|nr:FAD-dependent oxidoreductase [Sphaerotilus hippei]PXW95241.1 D-arginine dehydrogenase [Sphaerotilus hippei]